MPPVVGFLFGICALLAALELLCLRRQLLGRILAGVLLAADLLVVIVLLAVFVVR